MKNTKYGYEITSDLKGLDALYKRLQDLNQKEIQYGYFEESRYTTEDERGRNNTPVAQIAILHENGFSGEYGNIPARPFFTQSLKKAEWMVKQSAPAIYLAVLKGTQEKNFVAIAKWLKESVQDSIDEQDFTPLSDRTIKDKGHSKILVESGTLRDSVKAKIVNTDAYGTRKSEVDIK